MRKLALLIAVLLLATSCRLMDRRPLSYLQYAKRPISYAGMVVGSVESPVVLALSQAPLPTPYTRLNKPLDKDVRSALARMDRQWAQTDTAPRAGSLIRQREALFAREGLLDLRKEGETYDTFADLAEKDTIVLVAISGGGLRASRLAAHTLRLLESQYRDMAPLYLNDPPPMHEQIDAISSVSGGSIYTALVARQYANDLNDLLPQRLARPIQRQLSRLPLVGGGQQDRANRFFEELEKSPTVRWRTRSLGAYSVLTYLTPFTVPLYVLTDYDYTHHLAITLDLYSDIMPFVFTFGDLPRFAPRFFFNATDTETGAPFVFTQSIVHLPSERVLEVAAAQEDMPVAGAGIPGGRPLHPLFNALTLEDIHSSPARFPVSLAAMTSAAFPGLLNPVRLCTYGYDEKDGDFFRARRTLNLIDGGVYDNSGLTVLADLIEYLTLNGESGPPKTVLLLSINAEITKFDPNLFKRMAWGDIEPQKDEIDLVSFTSLWPFSALSNGVTAVGQVHFLNKRRAERLAVGRLNNLERDGLIRFHYFPVNLADVEWADPNASRPVTFEQLQRISTALALRSDEDQLLDRAAGYLLSKQRPAHQPLALDGGTSPTIAQAWAAALIRAQ